jgi:hypothetical protein
VKAAVEEVVPVKKTAPAEETGAIKKAVKKVPAKK